MLTFVAVPQRRPGLPELPPGLPELRCPKLSIIELYERDPSHTGLSVDTEAGPPVDAATGAPGAATGAAGAAISEPVDLSMDSSLDGIPGTWTGARARANSASEGYLAHSQKMGGSPGACRIRILSASCSTSDTRRTMGLPQ